MQEKQVGDEPKRVKYKRPRAQRACKTCHERKVKCNLQDTFPEKCTNCVQFNISECVVPEIKKRSRNPLQFGNTAIKQQVEKTASSDIGLGSQSDISQQQLPQQSNSSIILKNINIVESSTADDEFPFLNVIRLIPEKVLPKVRSKTIRDFVCSTTSSDIMRNTADEFINKVIIKKHIDRIPVSKFDLNVLKYAGAFNLPEERLCWVYINDYFETLHSLSPVLSKAAFMRDYRDLKNPPSILLLQTVIFAGARHHDNPNWTIEEREKHEAIVMIMFRRAKALYDADIEVEPIPLCQTFSIFSWSCEGKLFTSRTTVHWIKLGVFSIQAFRMDKNQESAKDLSFLEKKLYKRIFWSLYVKDRFVAMVFAQSFSIDLNKCTVPPLTLEDLSDDEPGNPSPYPSKTLDKLYFLEKLKFVELLDIVVENQSSSKRDVNYCTSLLSNWYKSVPQELSYRLQDKSSHTVMNASLAILYYTLLIAIHRTELVGRKLLPDTHEQRNSSWSVMFKSGHMIACIVDSLGHEGILSQIISCCVTHAASQFLLHVFNANPRISTIANQDILICLKFLNESKRSSVLGSFACSILSEIYTDKSKLVGLLLRVLSPEEFKELSELNENDLQKSNNISQNGFDTQPLVFHPISQNTVPLHQRDHQYKSNSQHNLGSPDKYNNLIPSSLSPQNRYVGPRRNELTPKNTLTKSPINRSDTSSSPYQNQYTQPSQIHADQLSGMKDEPFDPEELFRDELNVGVNHQITNTIPRFVAASISNSETNGSSDFSPSEGQASNGLGSLLTTNSNDARDSTWVLSQINTYWVPKFELPNQDNNIQNANSINYSNQDLMQNASHEYQKTDQQLDNYQKILSSSASHNGIGMMQQGGFPTEFASGSLSRDTNTLNNQWDLFNFF